MVIYMESFEHGGNIHKVLRDLSKNTEEPIDFSANINPLGPPEWFRPLVSSQLEQIIHYPDPDYTDFIDTIAKHTGVSAENIVVSNGTTELLYVISRAVQFKRALIPVPSYVDYVRALKLADINIEPFLIVEEEQFVLNFERLTAAILPGDLVIIATPNNPTGSVIDRDCILELASRFPDSFFLIDEAFLDFVEGSRSVALAGGNIMTMNSMTKFYGMPGLRIGYGTFPTILAQSVRRNLPPWTVNSLAQAIGMKCLEDREYQENTVALCTSLRRELVLQLQKYQQLKIYPAEANYLFCKFIDGRDVTEFATFCLDNGIMIRCCDNYQGLDGSYFRVAVRTRVENEKLIGVVGQYCLPEKKQKKAKKRVPSIMFQGTCSDAGKSIITSALCRILYQDGLNIAPFKAQNMSLNSFVTLQGDEMGRAQVVQAQAARLVPDYRMNPILLKPNSDTGSQVIVNGKPVGNMSVLEYNKYKPQIWDSVCTTYDSLAAEFDAVILEGAGSPGEVNLKADDIVNMRMAQYAGSPVILVGDIDRGGVYASFVGIMEVLAEWERRLVAGYLVNKFRGQASLLSSAHSYVKLHTGRDVFGVIPHIPHLGLPEEDSVSFKKGSFNAVEKHRDDTVEIVVISTPHISNFTDIEPFLEEPDVILRIVDNADDIGHPQAIVLPGSKNVIHDLHFLLQGGFVPKIDACLASGGEVVGVCGGYQMLGTVIKDPHQIESADGQINGLGFLNMETVIEESKRLTRKRGTHLQSRTEIYGYEIHHGVSSLSSQPLLSFDDGTTCGTFDRSGKIWGSYLHGIFDCDEFRRWYIDRLRVQAGLLPVGVILAPYDLEIAFDRLADCVRENIDMDSVYRLLNL